MRLIALALSAGHDPMLNISAHARPPVVGTNPSQRLSYTQVRTHNIMS
jgi:hypothetical protein